MSRILRRPMFRKGGLSSEDTGIVSGLGYRHRQGYAGGADSQGVQQNDVTNLSAADVAKQLNNPYFSYVPKTKEDLESQYKENLEKNKDISNLYGPLVSDFGTYQQDKLISDAAYKEMLENPIYKKSFISDQLKEEQRKINEANNARSILGLNKIQNVIQPSKTPTEELKKEDSFSETNLGNEAQSFLKQLKDLGIGPDQDALTRQRYLELAKFGFNLASQPTPVGYKPNLLNSIARAAEPVVPGLEKIEQQQQEQNQALKNAAVTLASKKIFPTSSAGETLAYLQSKGIKTPDAVNLIFGKAEQQQSAQLSTNMNYYQSAFGKKIDKNILNSVAQNAAIYTTKTGNPISVSDLQPFKPNSSVNNAQAGKYYYDENNGSIYLGNANGTYTSVTQPR